MQGLELRGRRSLWRLPGCYDPRASRPISSEAAARTDLTPAQVIERHSARHLPRLHARLPAGQAYLGDVPGARVAAPADAADADAGRIARHRDDDLHLSARNAVRLASHRTIARSRCGRAADAGRPAAPGDKVTFAPVSLANTRTCARGREAQLSIAPTDDAWEWRHEAGAARVAPGLLTTVQDLGRLGHQPLGVPVSGALDPVSLRAANALVGNAPDAGALEVAYVGPTLVVEADDVRLAFVGAHAAIDIFPDELAQDGARIGTMRSVRLRRGEVVRIGALTGGAVLYVAVEGGFDTAGAGQRVDLYSRRLRRLAGTRAGRGRPAAARARRGERAEECQLDGLDLSPPPRFRVILGPQNDHFSDRRSPILPRRIHRRRRRRPHGHAPRRPRARPSHGFDIASDGIAPGSIQVPGNGQPIVLLADRQTTGGYPKIATVISADLPALGRLPIGARFAFEPVTLEAAAKPRAANYSPRSTAWRAGSCRSASQAPTSPRGCFDCNLIGGVVDAALDVIAWPAQTPRRWLGKRPDIADALSRRAPTLRPPPSPGTTCRAAFSA